jgi:Ser/Thr protein kinase RdoA (MazF antagonist)
MKLVGGNSTEVTRVGDRVRRSAGAWTPTIHELLEHLRASGVMEVPKPFGVDSEGRELLSFMPGTVANYPLPDWLWSDAILEQAFSLLRRMHDATTDFRSVDELWQLPAHEPREVICHNDFAPYNLVFDEGKLVGVIDFDTASPGPRIWDFAYLVYRLVPFVEDAGVVAPSGEQRIPRLEAAIRAYGIPFEVDDVFEAMSTRLEELAVFTDGRATASGRPEFAEHAAMYRRDAAASRR